MRGRRTVPQQPCGTTSRPGLLLSQRRLTPDRSLRSSGSADPYGKADELAEPERLRVELRDARSEIRRLEKECAQRDRLVSQSERRLAKERRARQELEARTVQEDNVVAFWEDRARIAERRRWDLGHPGDSSE